MVRLEQLEVNFTQAAEQVFVFDKIDHLLKC